MNEGREQDLNCFKMGVFVRFLFFSFPIHFCFMIRHVLTIENHHFSQQTKSETFRNNRDPRVIELAKSFSRAAVHI